MRTELLTTGGAGPARFGRFPVGRMKGEKVLALQDLWLHNTGSDFRGCAGLLVRLEND